MNQSDQLDLFFAPHLVKPMEGESPLGLLLRNLMENMADSMDCHLLPPVPDNSPAYRNTYLRFLVQVEKLYSPYSKDLGMPPFYRSDEAKGGMKFVRLKGHLDDHIIDPLMMTSPQTEMKICPVCFRKNRFVHWSHDLFFVDTCLEHKCKLVKMDAKKVLRMDKSQVPHPETNFDEEHIHNLKFLVDAIRMDIDQLLMVHRAFAEKNISARSTGLQIRDTVASITEFMTVSKAKLSNRLDSARSKMPCIPPVILLHQECKGFNDLSFGLRRSVLSCTDKGECNNCNGNCGCGEFEIKAYDFAELLGMENIEITDLNKAGLPVTASGMIKGKDIGRFFSKHFPAGIGKYYDRKKEKGVCKVITLEKFIKDLPSFEGLKIFANWASQSCKTINVYLEEAPREWDEENLKAVSNLLEISNTVLNKLIDQEFLDVEVNGRGLLVVSKHSLEKFAATTTSLKDLASKYGIFNDILTFGQLLREAGVRWTGEYHGENPKHLFFVNSDLNDSVVMGARGEWNNKRFKRYLQKSPVRPLPGMGYAMI